MWCRLFGHKYINVAGHRWLNIGSTSILQQRYKCKRCGEVNYE